MNSRPRYRQPGPAAARLTITAPDETEPASEVDLARWLSQMRTDVAETVGGVMLRAARPVTLTSVPTILSASPGRLVGWSLHEVGGTNPFLLRLRNGTDSGAPLIACIACAAGQVVTGWFAPGGISFTEGLYLDVATGGSLSSQIEGSILLGAAD